MKDQRMSVAEYRSIHGLTHNKFGARAVVEDGYRFDSKLERDRYLYWKNQWAIGAITWFTRQVPFYLPGGIVWRADFLVVWRSALGIASRITVEDCKGVMTRVAINKIKQVEAIYGFKVHIVKRGDMR